MALYALAIQVIDNARALLQAIQVTGLHLGTTPGGAQEFNSPGMSSGVPVPIAILL